MCAPVCQTESGTFSPPHSHLLPFTRGQRHLLPLICHKDDMAVQGFQPSLWGHSPGTVPLVLQLPSHSPKRCMWCELAILNGQLEWMWTVFLWPAINWHGVHGVVPPSHPKSSWNRQPLASPPAGEVSYLFLTRSFSICLFFLHEPLNL